jgi:hypothetical protein
MSSGEKAPKKILELRPAALEGRSRVAPGSGETYSRVLQMPERAMPKEAPSTPKPLSPNVTNTQSVSANPEQSKLETSTSPAGGGGDKQLPTTERRRGGSRSRKPVGLYILVALMGAIIAVCLFAIYHLMGSPEVASSTEPSPSEISAPETEPVVVTPEQQQMIDVAMIKLRGGDAEAALERFKILKNDNPQIPSLDYLTALAALQAGDIPLAVSSVEASVAKGERVSDALALSAALEGMKSAGGGWQAMGDLRARAEYYLQQAIEADAANPSPYIELAMRLRGRGENDEARRMLEAARVRINPVDSFAILDTTLMLIQLQELPDDQLPSDLDPDKDTSSLMGSAYVSLRRGDFTAAAGFLETAKKRLPADLYYYLLGDPELRKYASQPQLTPLFQ